MGHAQHKNLEVDERIESVYSENTEVLDESKVLEHLETDIDHDDDHGRIIGIRNGVLVGAALWMVLITAVVIAL